MELLTIGEVATAVGLTPRALRLYDRLGLLPPAAVDPETGYRFYEPAQLDRARLVAALRRLDMPLVDIRAICELDSAAAATAIDLYRRQVAEGTAARERLATVLVDHLSGRNATMAPAATALDFRYAARTDTGAARHSNDDAAYADNRLLAVADGGPNSAAATTAIDTLRSSQLPEGSATDLLTTLGAAVTDADRLVRRSVAGDQQPFTTVTALLRSGTQLALVHVGDSRAYLLRGGELFQLTQDHSYVEALVDQGRLGRTEAGSHPHRGLLVRALGASDGQVEADLSLRTAIIDDRYLLCSDGLSAVVNRSDLCSGLGDADSPEGAVQALIDLAYAQGAPDNIACVVADAVSA